MKSVLRLALAIPMLWLAGCSVTDTVTQKITPYKMDIPQGNVVTQEMVSKLKPGMTKAQVRFIMGTPLIIDTFHANRWDYVYRNQVSGKPLEERKLTLYFEQDVLARVEGDVVPGNPAGEQPKKPAEQDKGSAADAPGSSGQSAAAREEKGFFGKMLDKIGL